MTIPFDELKRLEAEATKGEWEWHTGCSWWRLSSKNGPRSGNVICPVVNQYDKHPDLSIPNKSDAELIVALRNHALPLITAAEQAGKMAEALEAWATMYSDPEFMALKMAEQSDARLAVYSKTLAALRAYREAVG